jgi:threonine aldolase
LRNNVQRLQDDHDHATRVAVALAEFPAFSLQGTPQTNMVMLAPEMDIAPLQEHLLAEGIRISGRRWVFHQDISSEDVGRLLEACKRFA